MKQLSAAGRYLWAMPNTLGGLVVCLPFLLPGFNCRLCQGVIELHGKGIAWMLDRFSMSAVTLGHLILARNEGEIGWCRVHERVHVRQYEQWGPLFIPAYLAAGTIAWVRGRRPYRDNIFEVEAYLAGEPGHEGSGGNA